MVSRGFDYLRFAFPFDVFLFPLFLVFQGCFDYLYINRFSLLSSHIIHSLVERVLDLLALW